MKNILILLFSIITFSITAQITKPEETEFYEPVPKKVSTSAGEAPSDALVLFDGSDFAEWTHLDGRGVEWVREGDAMVVKPGTGNIQTKRKFRNFQLHIEWRSPLELVGEGQGRGNSGVFLQKRYEIQVLDSYSSSTYVNGQAGSIYKQSIPLVNACKPVGEWNSYDILYKAPIFNEDGIKVSPAYVTVLHNGVVIQNHTLILGTTEYIGFPKNKAHGPDAIMLQDHSNPTAFRNIWIREL
jgi:hypothetical protein